MMHLSLLCDAAVSDLFDDAAVPLPRDTAGARHHLQGVMRGLVFAAALLLPFALTFAPSAFGAHAGAAQNEVRP